MRQKYTVPAWDDLRSPASGINPVGSPSAATPSTTDGSLTFTKGNVAIAWFQLPHAWKEGSDVSIHIHWSKTSSAAGIVNWQIKYKWFNMGVADPGFSALIAGSESIPNSDVLGKQALYSFPLVSGTGKSLSSMMCVYLERVNDGVDTYAPSVNLYEIDIHYQLDAFGSNQMLTKV